MTERAPKGHWPVVTALQRVGFSRLRLYELYEWDDHVRDALAQFHDEWWSRLGYHLRGLEACLPDLEDDERRLAERLGVASARDYLGGLAALATEVGLDRVPMVGKPQSVMTGYLPSGTAQLHRYLWRLDRTLRWEAATEHAKGFLSPAAHPTFIGLASFGAPIPEVDTSIAGTEARWDPQTEVPADARRRLRRETRLSGDTIETELARIAKDGGYEFPDTSTQRSGIWRLDRDALWVWWRIRHQWTYEQIAEEWQQLNPGDHRLRYRDDPAARKWDAEHERAGWSLTNAVDAVPLVRKAVTTFAARAQVNVRTGPGRRVSRTLPRRPNPARTHCRSAPYWVIGSGMSEG